MAGWSPPAYDVSISNTIGDQSNPLIIPDGNGSLICVWEDTRSGDRYIYGQKVDAEGISAWEDNGTKLLDFIIPYNSFDICADGNGGVLIATLDLSCSNILIQHISSNGYQRWSVNGYDITANTFLKYHPKICSDGSGGAYIIWIDERREIPNMGDLYIQHVNASGISQWTQDGILLAYNITEPYKSLNVPQLCSDEAGGIIVAWVDHYPDINGTIRAQRIDTSGNFLWATEGEVVGNSTGLESYLQIHPDGFGGVIIGWIVRHTNEWLYESQKEIYTQKISSEGDLLWNENGTLVIKEPESSFTLDNEFNLISDKNGSSIILWKMIDENQDYGKIFVKKINSAGLIDWITQGIRISDTNSYTYEHRLYQNSPETFFLCWGGPVGLGHGVTIQSVNLSNAALLFENRTYVDDPTNMFPKNLEICSDGSTGAYVVWTKLDIHFPLTGRNIYGNLINENGERQWDAVPPDEPDEDYWWILIISIIGAGAFLGLYLIVRVRRK